MVLKFDLFALRKRFFCSSVVNINMIFISNCMLIRKSKVSYFKCLNWRYLYNENRNIQSVINNVRILSTVPSINSLTSDRTSINGEYMKLLEETFNCSPEEAFVLLKSNKRVLSSSNKQNLKKVTKFQKYGLSLMTIKENIWILQYSEKEVNSRINQLRKWKFEDINSAVKLISLPFGELQLYTVIIMSDFKFLKGRNRIQYFSHIVKCEDSVVCETFARQKFLLKMKVERLKKLIDVQLDGGVKPENLLSDTNLFRYSPKWISEKINKIKSSDDFDNNETVIKPWMLRCLPPVLKRSLEIKVLNKEATSPYSNWTEFLCKELNISQIQVDTMIEKHPPLAQVNSYKIKRMIKFLKEEGFSMQLAYKTPRIFCHKLETIKGRLNILRSLNYEVNSFQILCKNSKKFDSFIDKLKKLCKNKEEPHNDQRISNKNSS